MSNDAKERATSDNTKERPTSEDTEEQPTRDDVKERALREKHRGMSTDKRLSEHQVMGTVVTRESDSWVGDH